MIGARLIKIDMMPVEIARMHSTVNRLAIIDITQLRNLV